MKRITIVLVVSMILFGLCLGRGSPAAATQGPDFDKLSPEDRKTFQKRFEGDIWPLMMRNGKDGCIGCHATKIVSALHTTGDLAKDFHKMLKDGFFLVDDPGSLLSRITERNSKRRMPPGDRPLWTEAEIAKLRSFVIDIEQKQQ